MAQFKEKNKYSFWHSPLTLLVLLIIVVVFAYNMIDLIQKERDTHKNKISELKKIEELRERESLLSSDIEKLNTEEGIEESVRDKFQVVKPGERMVVIVDDTPKEENTEESMKEHGFRAFLKRFFNRD